MTVERIELGGGLSLRIADAAADTRAKGTSAATRAAGTSYPTRRLQKGLLLYAGEQELAEEGVGLGVPILKRGAQTVFPGSVRLWSGASGSADSDRVRNELDRFGEAHDATSLAAMTSEAAMLVGARSGSGGMVAIVMVPSP